MKLEALIATCVSALLGACTYNTTTNYEQGGDGSGSGSGSGKGGAGSGSGTHLSGSASGTAYALAGDTEGEASTSAIAYGVGVVVGGTQQFIMDVDTGSTTLGVAGSSCSSCGVSPEYAPASSAVATGNQADAAYGLGSWSGSIYADTVGLVGDASGLTMRFADIATQSQFFGGSTDQQGIIGVGPADLLLPNTDSYIAQRGVQSMAFQLCPGEGTMWIDGFDSSTITQPLEYVPFESSGSFYEAQIDSGSIGGSDVGFGGVAILDTGTTMMITSTGTANQIAAAIEASPGYQQIFGSQDITQTCVDPGSSSREQIDQMLPPFVYGIAGVTFSAPATQSYLFLQQGEYCLSASPDTSGTLSSVGADLLLGDAFLRNFVVQLDLANQQAGFAPQTGCALPPAAKRPVGPVTPHWRLRGHDI